MGEVYRARDTRLDRDVALKILPEAFVHDPDRVTRFQREARTLAALNHPHIGGIYGLEEAAGVTALVLELVEGPTLADRIARGPIPLDEALPIARQIAEALEAAHEHGIIHRDLKPANIKVRDDGTVKVLDFGLAKALGPTGGGGAVESPALLTQSPTLSMAATQAGVILGTAAYMSPEQARGKAVDKRADIWAFGCVLYEMLTGKRGFQGEDVSDVYVAIMRDEPDWNALPPDTPAPIRRLLRRALAKDPKLRFREAGSAIVEIEEARTASDPETRRVSPMPRLHLWQRPAAAATIALLVAVAAGAAVWSLTPPAGAPPQVVRFSIPLEEDTTFSGIGRHVVAISPDASHVAYAANNRIYLRQLDQMQATTVRGTEGGGGGGVGRSPFFSPDSRWLGFWAEGALKRVAVTGGAPVTLSRADLPLGAWWDEKGTILFGQGSTGIWQVPAAGGTAEVLIKVSDGEQAANPQRLPGGDWLLFTLRPAGVTDWNQAQIVVQSVGTGQRTVVIEGGRDARYLPTRHLVYALDDVLYAVPFDLDTRRVTGGAVSVVERVGDTSVFTSAAHFSVAANGSLVYAEGTGSLGGAQTFVWVDRAGRETLVPARPRPYQEFNLSPDGTRVAVRVQDAAPDIWIYDLERQTETRLTFDPATEVFPTWTPDGRRVALGGDGIPLSWRAADGTGGVEVLAESREEPNRVPQAFTPDAKMLVFEARLGVGAGSRTFLSRLTLDGSRSATRLLKDTAFTQRNAALSPDGRWLAYESPESGIAEVYVRPFTDVNAGRWQLSSGGGHWPAWHPSPRGRELFYVGPKGLMAASVTTTPTFTPGVVSALFDTPAYIGASLLEGANRRYAVAPDGRRFLFLKAATTASSGAATQRLMFVENWFEELKQRVPTK
jgi:eukaryotic-like serine/threonine-protein kinase